MFLVDGFGGFEAEVGEPEASDIGSEREEGCQGMDAVEVRELESLDPREYASQNTKDRVLRSMVVRILRRGLNCSLKDLEMYQIWKGTCSIDEIFHV